MAAKAGWTRVAFGDVVRHVKERVDPDESGLERYVAGEHMNTDDLRIRRWGTIGDGYLGPAFHMRFIPGQVLYGSRRTYLRKVAVADFEGITANTTFVLESKSPRVLLPELLPFVMQTEAFHEHAIKQSKGSVNPYINFSDLTWFEFALPPIDLQRAIADALKSAADVDDSFSSLRASLANLIFRQATTAYESASRTGLLRRIGEVADVKMGRQKAPKYMKGKNARPFLSVANIGDLELQLKTVQHMDFTALEFERFRLVQGDILMTEGDLVSPRNVGRPAVFRGEVEGCCFQNTLIRLRFGRGIDVDYMLLMLEGARLTGVFAAAAKTTTVTHLGLGRLQDVAIPVVSYDEQQLLGRRMRELLDARDRVRQRQCGVRLLQRKLVTDLLG